VNALRTATPRTAGSGLPAKRAPPEPRPARDCVGTCPQPHSPARLARPPGAQTPTRRSRHKPRRWRRVALARSRVTATTVTTCAAATATARIHARRRGRSCRSPPSIESLSTRQLARSIVSPSSTSLQQAAQADSGWLVSQTPPTPNSPGGPRPRKGTSCPRLARRPHQRTQRIRRPGLSQSRQKSGPEVSPQRLGGQSLSSLRPA
jgi:hypothetical protein